MHVHCDPIVSILEPSCRSELAESRKRKKVVPKSNYRDKYEHLIGGADDVARVGSKGSVQKDASYTQYIFSWGKSLFMGIQIHIRKHATRSTSLLGNSVLSKICVISEHCLLGSRMYTFCTWLCTLPLHLFLVYLLHHLFHLLGGKPYRLSYSGRICASFPSTLFGV